MKVTGEDRLERPSGLAGKKLFRGSSVVVTAKVGENGSHVSGQRAWSGLGIVGGL